MNRFFLISLVLIVVSVMPLRGQNRLYENPKFKAIAATHEVIAILPFKATVSLRPKQMEKMTSEQLADLEKNEGLGIQQAMYSWFLTRDQRGTLLVNVQNPMESNATLNKNGITVDNISQYSPTELAELLGVDAVIMGTFETSKPMSEGASIVLGALLGFWGNTNRATLNMFIYNAEDGETLCNYHRGISGSIGTSPENLINKLMRKASRKIAYTSN